MSGVGGSTPLRLKDAVVRFVRLARERGLLAGAAESADALRAIGAIDIGDRDEVYLALRSILASSRDNLPVFDTLFTEFWSPGGLRENRIPRPMAPARPRPAPPRPSSFSMAGWLRNAPDDAESVESKTASTSSSPGGAPPAFGRAELDEIARIARQVARRLANRAGRRWERWPRGARVDLRRSMRMSISTGGDLLQLARRRRRMRKLRIVALCDVSGSMDLYTRFFLHFLRALQHTGARAETFVFATRLTRITEQLGVRRVDQMAEWLAASPADWSGGTRIGESLAQAERSFSALFDRHTIMIVLSDGWDTGHPELLGASLRSLAARVRRVIWLNPLLGSPTYRPLAQGVLAALPHVDLFAPLHDLPSLRRLARQLVS
jgi:uncharacterized protein with von Willebrand factor type A (vWA) domain